PRTIPTSRSAPTSRGAPVSPRPRARRSRAGSPVATPSPTACANRASRRAEPRRPRPGRDSGRRGFAERRAPLLGALPHAQVGLGRAEERLELFVADAVAPRVLDQLGH